MGELHHPRGRARLADLQDAPAFFPVPNRTDPARHRRSTRLRQEAENRAAKMEMRMASLESEIEHIRTEARSEMAKEAGRIRQGNRAGARSHPGSRRAGSAALSKHAEKDLRVYARKLAIELAEQRIRAPDVRKRQEGSLMDSLRPHEPESRSRQGGPPVILSLAASRYGRALAEVVLEPGSRLNPRRSERNSCGASKSPAFHPSRLAARHVLARCSEFEEARRDRPIVRANWASRRRSGTSFTSSSIIAGSNNCQRSGSPSRPQSTRHWVSFEPT